MSARMDGRTPTEVRPIRIHAPFLRQPPGSALIEWGGTRVLVAVSLEDRVPAFLQGTGQGWISADYTLLSRMGGSRVTPTSDRGSASGRAIEIRRLIGRSLRAAVDLLAIGEVTVWVDCDVLEADGGTRVAAVTGGWVALALAFDQWVRRGNLPRWPMTHVVAGISMGLLRNQLLVDLNYFEDSQADVDINVVMTATGHLVELQVLGEHGTLTPSALATALHTAWTALRPIFQLQYETLAPHLRSDHLTQVRSRLLLPEHLP